METFEFIILIFGTMTAAATLVIIWKRVRAIRASIPTKSSVVPLIGRPNGHPNTDEKVVRFRMDPIRALDPSILDDVEYRDVTEEVNAGIVD